MKAAGITEGPLFRRLAKGGKVLPAGLTPFSIGGKVLPAGLTPFSIGEIVKHYAGLAGFTEADFAGHSLRAGFLTSAAENGASVFRMMDVSRHKSVDTVRGYVRRAEEFQDHAGEGLL